MRTSLVSAACGDYLHAVVEQARKDGYTSTLYGRRRYLPDLNSDNRQRREVAERACPQCADPGALRPTSSRWR